MSTVAPRNQEKRKYEKPHLSFNRRPVRQCFCIAGVDIVCPKGPRVCPEANRHFKGRGDIAAAWPYAAARAQSPTHSSGGSTEGGSDQERQLAFKDSESSTAQSHSSAN